MSVITFDSRIQGIPCQIEVTSYNYTPPWRGNPHECPSDLDYYGYIEAEYIVLDRKGYEASWLAEKITDEDDERIYEEIKEEMSSDSLI